MTQVVDVQVSRAFHKQHIASTVQIGGRIGQSGWSGCVRLLLLFHFHPTYSCRLITVIR
jgi:hypothetical protein